MSFAAQAFQRGPILRDTLDIGGTARLRGRGPGLTSQHFQQLFNSHDDVNHAVTLATQRARYVEQVGRNINMATAPHLVHLSWMTPDIRLPQERAYMQIAVPPRVQRMLGLRAIIPGATLNRDEQPDLYVRTRRPDDPGPYSGYQPPRPDYI